MDDGTRMVTVEEKPGRHKLYSITQIKPYLGDQKYAVVQNIGESLGPWSTRHMEEKGENGEVDEAEIFITEVLDRNDSRT